MLICVLLVIDWGCEEAFDYLLNMSVFKHNKNNLNLQP